MLLTCEAVSLGDQWLCGSEAAGSSPGCISKGIQHKTFANYFVVQVACCGDSCRKEQPNKQTKKKKRSG